MKGFSEWVKQVQRYKLPVIKLISPEHVTHGMVTRVSNTILYIWELLREENFIVNLIVFITGNHCNSVASI